MSDNGFYLYTDTDGRKLTQVIGYGSVLAIIDTPQKYHDLPTGLYDSTPDGLLTPQAKYDAAQPRDHNGRWTNGGGGGGQIHPALGAEIGGTGASKDVLREGLAALPPEHWKLANPRLRLEASPRADLYVGPGTNAFYETYEKRPPRIVLADIVGTNFGDRPVKDQIGIAAHEFGHAIDMPSYNGTPSFSSDKQFQRTAIGEYNRYLLSDVFGVGASQMQHYLSSPQEFFAETYRMVYASPKSTDAFGTSRERAMKIFPQTAAYVVSMLERKLAALRTMEG